MGKDDILMDLNPFDNIWDKVKDKVQDVVDAAILRATIKLHEGIARSECMTLIRINPKRTADYNKALEVFRDN